MRSTTKNLVAAATGVLLAGTASGHRPRGEICDELSASLPGRVSFPNSTEYALSNSYWSELQAEVHPACFVTPSSTAEVSKTMKMLVRMRAPFTVKGGGHAQFAGASNIEDGVTIDMNLLKEVTVSEDRETVSVGAGAKWIDVTTTLDPLGLAVVGGRASDVGVPGLVLGGGLSFFSGMYGWACDNVREYEIVVASGDVLTASPTENEDLYWALRGGGGSNFGIVTRFDLMSFEQGDLWQQSLIMPGAVVPQFLAQYQDLAVNGLPADEEGHTFFAYTYLAALGGYTGITSFYHASYAETSDAETTIPSVFQPYQPAAAIVNATTVANITARTMEIDEEYGHRKIWRDATVKATDPELFADMIPIFHDLVETLNQTASLPDGSPEVSSFLAMQPITTNVLEHMQKNGGNALGLDPEDGPLMIIQLFATWDNPGYDEMIQEEYTKALDQIRELAEGKGLLHPYKYINYASPDQDVFEGYGKENEMRLRRIARKYDRRQVLQKYWQGYFQLS